METVNPPGQRASCLHLAGFCMCTHSSDICGSNKCKCLWLEHGMNVRWRNKRIQCVEWAVGIIFKWRLPNGRWCAEGKGWCFVAALYANKRELVLCCSVYVQKKKKNVMRYGETVLGTLTNNCVIATVHKRSCLELCFLNKIYSLTTRSCRFDTIHSWCCMSRRFNEVETWSICRHFRINREP